ncbi:multisite-specific tRNA:(cytosine-C(5))-methyltransferase [Malassezia sp. CBS 17886]|nr:multisite-specific tRNA:(cytosine-C(5))-methyltransferase [Malassezia sp. CBS 17886]
MARGRSFKRGRGGRGRGSRGSGGARQGDYTTIDQKNAKFEAYYIGQGILPPDEWDAFMASLRTPLPTTFRITSGKATSKQLMDAMQSIYLPFLSNVEFEGERVAPPRQLPWYPEGLGWHLDVRKNVLRKSPEFKRFQQFLVHETDVGAISRQEAVSMLPPLFLDVQPEHLVLDMCAAPGSKTAQLIEAIHSPLTSEPDAFIPMPLGAVVANDADTKRAHMLVHQAQRLPSPNLCVTNLDASNLPNVNVAWKGPQPTDKLRQRELKYDRILVDVPCSGDGTLRKNIAIWKDWTAGNGVGLHSLQTRILLRGLALLRPGGRLVYSTCSLNPIENEAVIAAALRHHKGDVELVDCSDMLPALVRRTGMTEWRVAPGRGAHLFGADAPQAAQPDGQDAAAAAAVASEPDSGAAAPQDEGNAASGDADAATAPSPTPLPRIPWVESWDALQSLDADLAARLPRSLWPQGDEKNLHLGRCVRVYPHMQNTGGFFVACLVKREAAPEESEGMAEGMARAIAAMDAGEVPLSMKRDAEETSDAAPAKRAKREEGAESAAAAADEEAAETGESMEATSAAGGPADQRDGAVASETAAEIAARPATAESPVPSDKHVTDREIAQARRRTKEENVVIGAGGMPYREDPFAYVAPSNPEIRSCIEWFGLASSFPVGNFLVRNAEQVPLRSIYATSGSVRAIVSGGGAGAGVHPTLNPIRLRLLNCGVKVFARQESVSKATKAREAEDNSTDDGLARRSNGPAVLACRWRVVSDSLHTMRPYLGDKVVIDVTLANLAFFIKEYYPVLDSVPDAVGARLRDSPMGSYVLQIQPSEYDGHTLNVPLYYPIWRSVASVNLMLDKQEKRYGEAVVLLTSSALSYRLFDSDLSDPEGQRQFSSNPQARRMGDAAGSPAQGGSSGVDQQTVESASGAVAGIEDPST